MQTSIGQPLKHSKVGFSSFLITTNGVQKFRRSCYLEGWLMNSLKLARVLETHIFAMQRNTRPVNKFPLNEWNSTKSTLKRAKPATSACHLFCRSFGSPTEKYHQLPYRLHRGNLGTSKSSHTHVPFAWRRAGSRDVAPVCECVFVGAAPSRRQMSDSYTAQCEA
jgi:hypothetical protein